jgi:hypothetical protein
LWERFSTAIYSVVQTLTNLDRITGLTGYYFCLVGHYPVDPVCRGEVFLRRLVDPVKKIKKIEYLTSKFDIPYSTFDIRFFGVSFSIRLAAFQASGWAEH